MSSYLPSTAKEIFSPHHYRTGSKGEKLHRKIGVHQEGPKTATPGPPPVIEDTAGRQQDEADRIRMRKGRASAILTPGGAGTPLTAAKTLLGG